MTMAVGIAADHGGFALKAELASLLRGAGFRVSDFRCIDAPPPDDDYPDLIVPLARVVVAGEVETGDCDLRQRRGGACVVANKLAGVRAGLCTDTYSAHQGVEDDDMNILCIRCSGYRSGIGVGIGSSISRGEISR
jgi:ribose 5-phosphate isomerase B